LALATAGVGAAVVPESVVPPAGPLRAVHFRNATMKRTIGLASRRDRPFSPAAEAFVHALHEHLRGE
jgi:DNA-binding transcriptional LysR family regulator